MEELYKDFINILNIKSEKQIIKDIQSLIKNIGKKEQYELIYKIKIEIENLNLKRIKDIINNRKIDEYTLSLLIKIIYKDKETLKEIEELKIEKNKKETIEELNKIKINAEETSEEIINQIEKIIKLKTKNYTIIEEITSKDKKEKQQEINKLSEITEDSKHKHENKKIKGEIYSKTDLQETLEMLESIIETNDYEKLNTLEIKLKKDYTELLKKIENEIKKNQTLNKQNKKYNEKLIEYIYNKKNNSISYAIDLLEKDESDIIFIIIITLEIINEIEQNNIKQYIEYKENNQIQYQKRK